MSRRRLTTLKRALRNEEGQALPFFALTIVLYLGMTGLTVDAGHAFVCYRELQATTDAAALAAGSAMASSTATVASVKAAAQNYSSVAGSLNADPNMTGVAITTNLLCLSSVTTAGIPCAASTTGYNSVEVIQTASVPTFFIRALSVFGINSASTVPISTVSTASMKGAVNAQYNVAIVVDTTSSMGDPDPDQNCNGSQIQCALSGVQVLLNSLTPCGRGATRPTALPGSIR